MYTDEFRACIGVVGGALATKRALLTASGDCLECRA